MTSSSDQYFPFAPGPSPGPISYGEQRLDNTVYPTGDHLKGQFINFASGQWAGRTIRAELCELQHADRGRKYADVDRRTLDPPPVVSLRFFELIQKGLGYEQIEISSYEDIETIGLLCAVELVPVPESNDEQSCTDIPTFSTQPCTNVFSHFTYSHMNNLPDSSYIYEPKESMDSGPASPAFCSPQRQVPPGDVTQLTHHALVGSKVIQSYLLDLNSKQTLLFVFSDLAVRKTGLYKLRYRCFNICARIFGCEDAIVQDECCGGTFRIFSTKTFPGLEESTALTRILSSQGVPLNVRYEKRRTKRKRISRGQQGDEHSPPAYCSSPEVTLFNSG